ncbi:MAG: DUF1015 domain-containing protein [Acidobacteria bacterium]|nr:DUF1015 domain-containing protein [Acidobacteriota bacterium]
MATIKPFKALRPKREFAEQVSCVPYDVLTKAEARQYVAENQLSFLRVTRPKSDFPKGEVPPWNVVVEHAKANLRWFIEEGYLKRDKKDAIYIYRLSRKGQSQTGVVACLSLDEYEAGVIKKHENVRPEKVNDRAAHIVSLRAQTGLIFTAFRGTEEIERLIAEAVAGEPLYDYVAPEGVSQQVWRCTETTPFVEAFAGVPSIYIADGHHRIEGARLARLELHRQDHAPSPDAEYNFVMAAMFPADELRILPYNRVVRDLNGLTTEEFLERAAEHFVITEADTAEPSEHGEILTYVAGNWYDMRFRADHMAHRDPIHNLDVSILQDFLLAPVLGITDPTTSERIEFISGMRGTAELERLVDSGEAVAAFSLYATRMKDLLTVSDMGETMPPKSTWFEPKLKDGLLVHEI